MNFHPLLNEHERKLRDMLRSSTLTTCYRWANARRWVEDEDYSGYYSAHEYPYIVVPQNSNAAINVLMKAAQTGGSEAVINRALYEVDHCRRNVIYLMPTTKAADIFSKTRLANAIKYSPYLQDRIEDSIDVKKIGGYALYVKGAKNNINLKSTPASVLILDEVAELAEGQIWMAMTRLHGHRNAMLWAISTPMYPGRDIHKLYLKTTQEHYNFRCPHCGHFIELLWPDCMEICGDSVDDDDVMRSRLICPRPSCRMTLEHDAKPEYLAETINGKVNASWEITNSKSTLESRGWYLPQFYSPKAMPHMIAIDYHRGRGDEEANAEFWRSRLGLPYVQAGSRVTDEDIDACVELKNFSTIGRPLTRNDKMIITVGLDRGPVNYWVACQWFVGKGENGDINDRSVPRVIGFGKFMQENQEEAYQLMRRFRTLGLVQDAEPHRQEARKLCRRWNLVTLNYVWMCQYVEGKVARDVLVTDDETGAPLAKVDKTAWASIVLGRVMGQRIELPRDISLDFRTHLKNLIREISKGQDGNYESRYYSAGDDHYTNALIYAEIGLRLINLDHMAGDDSIKSLRD